MYFTPEALADLHQGVEELHDQFADLRERYVLRQFQNAGAREHADHGFSRRLSTLVRCVDRVFEILPPDRADIPTRDETVDATINIQSFVMNAFGCCENLAWIWVLERGVVQPNGAALPAGRVGLGAAYQNVRESFSPVFRGYLDGREPWFAHLKDFRDALAHRIPLYIPPHTVAPEDGAQYQALGQAAYAALLHGDLDAEVNLKAEQMALARFQPIMTHSLTAAANVVVFHPQLLADFATINELACEFLTELDR